MAYKLKIKNKDESDKISTLKSSIACPPHLVRILEKQTGLTEPQIHVRYMTFRHQYPTGFVGPHVLRNLCLDVLNEKDCEEYVDMVFKLYGQRKRGWGAKLIGFREVVLATEGIAHLDKPEEILKWIFRVHDSNADGEIPVNRIESIISSLLSLCVCLKDNESLEEIVNEFVADYDVSPYEDNLISEEEFVYDCLHHAQLHILLQSSLRSYNIELKFDDLSSDDSD